MSQLKLYNTLTRQKELFQPLHPPFVGLYVCGPTVYNYVHLGNIRTFLSFDILFRYLLYLEYKVRYVRNITDVGHLVDDEEEGEDKIGRIAKMEKIQPMEVVHRYTQNFHGVLEQMNLLPTNIEPTATGHIVEQIEAVKSLIDKGFAYEKNGSVYFDIETFLTSGNDYGKLSGRVLEDLRNDTRDLDGQKDKKSPLDFALWKKASPEHIMRWQSPWGEGFPGWHLECTCMSTKYLGETFDIHGGGMDLKFPHHECEIAQAVGLNGISPVRIWMHTNMLTVNGQKMSKSLGNSFLPQELFLGSHPTLAQAFSPMTVRFFMLQAHYRSTLDFSNEALKAAQKAYLKLMNGLRVVRNLNFSIASESVQNKNTEEIQKAIEGCFEGLNDDLNTAVTLAHLFTLVKKINQLYTKQISIEDLGTVLFEKMKIIFLTVVEDILGLKEEKNTNTEMILEGLLRLYKDFKETKQYDKIDQLRLIFKQSGLSISDMKTGVDWRYDEIN